MNDGLKEKKVSAFDRALRVTAYASGFAAIALSVMTGLVPDQGGLSDLLNQTAVESDRQRLQDDNKQAERQRDGSRERIRLGSRQNQPQLERDMPLHHDGLWFDRAAILADDDMRIDDAFAISPGLNERVGFWFDIYSRYDSHKRVIHHAHFPWIIFKVVDVEPIISSSFPKFRWQRNQIADDVVKKELAAVRMALNSVANKARLSDLDSDKLTDTELRVRNALQGLVNGGNGDVRKHARRARHEVRVQTGQRNFFAEGLQTAPRYLGVMEEIFEKHRLPVELTRLPLVESSFNKHAKSKVGAAGIWQFMENTGRKKKLIIDSLIDERKSPFKATDAAARLLKENHMILGRSWELAVTAWNHGPGGVKKASRAAGTRDLAKIIERYHSKRFDFASENFYAEFLAALYTERYSDSIFPGLPRHAPLAIQELKLSRKIRVGEILKVASLSMDEFESINPDLIQLLRSKQPLMKGLRIHIPSDAKSAVEYLMAGEDADQRFIGANG